MRSILRAGVLPADIYVIDDGSSDGTGEIARSFNVNVVRNEKNIGKAHSLARLASVSELVRRYDYICLMDADTQVSEDYFQSIRGSFSQPGVAVVCGRAKSTPHNWLTAYRCLAYWISHAIYKDGQSNMGVITVTPGCAAAFRADAFAQLGVEQRHHRRGHGLHHPSASQETGQDRLPEACCGFHSGPQNSS